MAMVEVQGEAVTESKSEKLAEKVDGEEKKIPVFTVLKNNSILKNIFLIDRPPSPPFSSSSNSRGRKTPAVTEQDLEEILVVGRHPDCSITLEHPSISRFHLRIHSVPSVQSLSVFDLSSVHGTWVSGKKIEPGVRVELQEGDTLQLGGSSRVYRLHWIPVNQAYDFKHPLVVPIDELKPVEEIEEETHQDEDGSHLQNDPSQKEADDLEFLDLLFNDLNTVSQVKQLTPSAPFMPEEMKPISHAEEEFADKTLLQHSEIADQQPVWLFDKENSMSDTNFTSGYSPIETQPENPESPPLMPQLRSGVSIWKRRGKSASVQIETSKGKESSRKAPPEFEMKAKGQEDLTIESIPEDLFARSDRPEEVFTSDEENYAPLSRSFKEIEQEKKNESSVNSMNTCVYEDDEEAFTLDKENIAPSTPKSMKKLDMLEEIDCSKTYRSSPLKHSNSSTHQGEDNGTSEGGNQFRKILQVKENCSPDTLLSRSLKKIGKEKKYELNVNSSNTCMYGDDEEAFTPDKENISPNTLLLRSMKKMDKLEETNHPKTYISSPLKSGYSIIHQGVDSGSSEKGNAFRKVLQVKKSARLASRSHARLHTNKNVLKDRADRAPFQSLLESPSVTYPQPLEPDVSSKSSNPNNNAQIKEAINPFTNTFKEKNKRWTMVVDTTCLLNKESRKALQLMQGLNGTNLIIPRIVIRELDCMKRRSNLFRRTTEVCSVLQWIEDCMTNAHWWIHVQSSMEDVRPTAPTPPATPLGQFSEEKEKFSMNSVPFSPSATLLEIVSPTTEDHILDCALFFRRIQNNGQLVLLSNDVTLKIKAMAEGLLCETAAEFRDSLVNPFSERFLWTDSSPRGPTWSCLDDVILREKYYNGPLKKASKVGDGAKGLKLILLHNSNFKKISSVS